MKYHVIESVSGEHILAKDLIDPHDIELPSPSILPKYSILLSGQGEYWVLWDDISVIDVTPLFDHNIHYSSVINFLEKLPTTQYPLVIRIDDIYAIRDMIDVDIDMYDKFLLDYILSMRRIIPKHTILRSKRYNGIYRLSQDTEVIDITDKVSLHMIDNIPDYTIVCNDHIIYGDNPSVTMDEPYDIFIYQDDSYWKISLTHIDGSEKVTTTNGYIRVGFASSKESLLAIIHDM